MDARASRRSDRIWLSVPIEISGIDARGQQFVTQGKTVVISRHGATIFVARRIALEKTINIRLLSKGKEAEFRIIGQIGEQDLGFSYAAAFSDQDLQFWDIEFPSLSEAEKSVGRVLLECVRCQVCELIYLNEVEMEVFSSNQSIERFCKSCARSSLWTSDATQPTSVMDLEQSQAPIAPTVVSEAEIETGKRLSARLKLKMQLCIRQRGAVEDVRTTENVSRGGFCFKSNRQYHSGSEFEVAVPYDESSANIFVPARIVHGTPLTEESLHKYGASYVRRQSL